MALFKLNKNLKNALQQKAESLKEAAKDGTLSDTLKSAVNDTKTKIQNYDYKAAGSQITDKFNQVVASAEDGTLTESIKSTMIDTKSKIQNFDYKTAGSQISDKWKSLTASVEETQINGVISVKAALQIFYYMMAADGTIEEEEEEKYSLIKKELDPENHVSMNEIITEYNRKLDQAIDPDDFEDVIRDAVDTTLANDVVTSDSFITPKLLIWDLLTIAFSDNDYDESERKLLKVSEIWLHGLIIPKRISLMWIL